MRRFSCYQPESACACPTCQSCDGMNSRHNVRMRDDFYRPLPVKAEAVLTVVESVSTGPSEPATPDQLDSPEIIDESERLLSAGELYADALDGSTSASPARAKARRPSIAAAQPRMQLWGAGTSGIPRRGSRTIRLFRTSPDDLYTALIDSSQGPLVFHTFEMVSVLDEMELHGHGELNNAYALRSGPVPVTLRAARFNSMFLAVELRLDSRKHPRNFFRAAHNAIEHLDLPGRT